MLQNWSRPKVEQLKGKQDYLGNLVLDFPFVIYGNCCLTFLVFSEGGLSLMPCPCMKGIGVSNKSFQRPSRTSLRKPELANSRIKQIIHRKKTKLINSGHF